jgi:spermidine synthase
VYQWIGLLVTAFMAGLAGGGLAMNRWLAAAPESPAVGRVRVRFLGLEGALVAFWFLLPLLLATLYARSQQPGVFAAIQPLLLLSNSAAGFLVGAQFPLANRLWLRGRPVQGREGALYAADLAGAFVGAVGVSVLLVPVLGIVGTCLSLAFFKLASLVLVWLLPAGD